MWVLCVKNCIAVIFKCFLCINLTKKSTSVHYSVCTLTQLCAQICTNKFRPREMYTKKSKTNLYMIRCTEKNCGAHDKYIRKQNSAKCTSIWKSSINIRHIHVYIDSQNYLAFFAFIYDFFINYCLPNTWPMSYSR